MDAQWDVCFHKLFILVILLFMTCVGFSFLLPVLSLKMMIRERTALDPIAWTAGSLPEKRKVDRAGRYCTWLPGPVNIWNGGWHGWLDSSVTQHDVASWP